MKERKNEKIHYRKFQKARLEEEVHNWLEKENGRYKSWNQFFKELKKRYESKTISSQSEERRDL